MKRPTDSTPGAVNRRRRQRLRERWADRRMLRWWLSGGPYGWGVRDSDDGDTPPRGWLP